MPTPTENRIKQIVNEAIPLDMKCAIIREEQIERKAKLRIEIEQLLRDEKEQATVIIGGNDLIIEYQRKGGAEPNY